MAAYGMLEMQPQNLLQCGLIKMSKRKKKNSITFHWQCIAIDANSNGQKESKLNFFLIFPFYHYLWYSLLQMMMMIVMMVVMQSYRMSLLKYIAIFPTVISFFDLVNIQAVSKCNSLKPLTLTRDMCGI